MSQEGIPTTVAAVRGAPVQLAFFGLLCLFLANFPLFAEEPQSTESAPAASTLDLELLSRGEPLSPLVWKAFRQIPIPPVTSSNVPRVTDHIRERKLAL